MLQQRALSHSLPETDKREAVSGDTEFTGIFEAYYERIFNYIRYRVGSLYTTEDLTSQVFEKALTKRSTFRIDRSPFEVWLLAIARNAVNDYFRRQRRQRLFSLDLLKEAISGQKGPESLTLVKESEEQLNRALLTLNAKERHINALKFGADLKNVQIAELIGMSESNVGVTLFRVMKKLKSELERMGAHD
ncbi:sigma-70 family RNA polymerase sigma factor [Paenibacillus sp. M1]|uniref:Sigma-70 family RNA polymerase sigma factor n=1 Tax=Paenibacillus haidiansis TaxID=1574488 RepID=A0ABU7VRH4_9BACL